MDTKVPPVKPSYELAVPCSTINCACCHQPEDIDLMHLCSRCGQFTHERGEANCAGECGCAARGRA